MKRLLSLGAVLVLAVASIVLAQSSGPALLRTPSGDHPITIVEQGGQTYVAAAEVVAGLGGTLVPDSTGFRVTIGATSAAFGPDSRYGVVRDDLIEMPVPPISIEGKPFVPWQFFHGLLSKSSSQDVFWDAAAKALVVRPQ